MDIQNRDRTRLQGTQKFVNYQIIFSEDAQATILEKSCESQNNIALRNMRNNWNGFLNYFEPYDLPDTIF